MIKVFKSLPKGIQRSIVVGAVLTSLLLGAFFNTIDEDEITGDYIFYVLFPGLPITILIIVAGLWIYSGFEEDKKS